MTTQPDHAPSTPCSICRKTYPHRHSGEQGTYDYPGMFPSDHAPSTTGENRMVEQRDLAPDPMCPDCDHAAVHAENEQYRKRLDEIEAAWAKASARAREIKTESERLRAALDQITRLVYSNDDATGLRTALLIASRALGNPEPRPE